MDFCQRKEADVALFLQVTRTRKIRKVCEVNYCPKQVAHKQRTLKHEINKTDQNPAITKHKPGPFEFVQVNVCFLRGPMIDGTEKPQIPLNFAKRTAQYNKFRVIPLILNLLHVGRALSKNQNWVAILFILKIIKGFLNVLG